MRAVEVFPVEQSLAALPLQFEPDQDQTGDQVKFLACGKDYSLVLTQTEAVPALRNSHRSIPTVVLLRLTSTDPPTGAIGTKELDGKVNYFLGNDPSCWRRDIPTFAKFVYTRVYEGIDCAGDDRLQPLSPFLTGRSIGLLRYDL
jgi:hypothetical protein